MSRERSGYVVRTADVIVREAAPEGSAARDERLVFLGPDPDGVVLEVMAVETAHGLLVIHAMPIRTMYAPHLEGGSP